MLTEMKMPTNSAVDAAPPGMDGRPQRRGLTAPGCNQSRVSATVDPRLAEPIRSSYATFSKTLEPQSQTCATRTSRCPNRVQAHSALASSVTSQTELRQRWSMVVVPSEDSLSLLFRLDLFFHRPISQSAPIPDNLLKRPISRRLRQSDRKERRPETRLSHIVPHLVCCWVTSSLFPHDGRPRRLIAGHDPWSSTPARTPTHSLPHFARAVHF